MNRFIVALFVAMAFAGCADNSGDGPQFVDKETFNIDNGKGAIAGFVVDDRFRPIQLGETASSEFQSRGFVLLQETGEEVPTTENGEFTFVNLDPGRYTLRVQSEFHESKVTQVEVVAGVFADVSIIAQRKVSDQTTVLTQEYSIFVDCYVDTPAFWWTELNCFLDMSLDSKRGGFQTDYTAVDGITYMLAEFLFNQQGDFGAGIGYAEGESISETWARGSTGGGDYARILMGTEGYHNETDGMLDASRQFLTYVSPDGSAPVTFGVAVEAQIIQTVWLGEPDEDVFTYCVLCQ